MVEVGVAVTTESVADDNVEEGVHEYVSPPITSIVVDDPKQIAVAVAVSVIVNPGATASAEG